MKLGRVKIGENIKLESSKVAPIAEKATKQQCSGNGIDGSAQKQNPCVALQSAKKAPYVTKTVQSSKGQNTKSKRQGNKADEHVNFQSFEKAFGGGALCSQLGTQNVVDNHDLNLEKDKESLAILRTLIKSFCMKM